MPGFDTLGGVLQAFQFEHIYLIGSGLTPGTTYYLFFASLNENQDASAASSKQANANGNLVFDITQGTQDFTYILHTDPNTASGNIIYRVPGAPFIGASWGPGYPVPSYGTPAVLRHAAPGNTIVSLNWNAAVPCDARVSTLTYQVRSSSVAPPPNPASILVSNLTVTNYLVTGVANGTSHWYLIRSTFKYVDDLITPAGPFDSNVLSASLPASGALRQSVGVLAA